MYILLCSSRNLARTNMRRHQREADVETMAAGRPRLSSPQARTARMLVQMSGNGTMPQQNVEYDECDRKAQLCTVHLCYQHY